jgi:hypothetical protein
VPRPPRLLPVLLLALAATAARAAEAPAPPLDAPGAERGPDLVSFRFEWPAPLEAQVTYRRTRVRTGAKPVVFVARYASRVARDEGAFLVRTAGTRWDGDLPFPRALADAALRASEKVVQRVGETGEFAGLEGADAMRPVLAELLSDAKLPPDDVERAVAVALAGLRGEAEELWNLAVGFWIGADLELAAPYVKRTEAELPLVPGVRAASAVEFQVRRRVPCAANERSRAPRCVEVTLRATPDPAAVERAARLVGARLLGPDAPPETELAELALESGLLLVTDPTTLLPRRLVWTKAIRAGGGEKGPAVELVDRAEYDYRYDGPRPPPVAPPARSRPGARSATSARR